MSTLTPKAPWLSMGAQSSSLSERNPSRKLALPGPARTGDETASSATDASARANAFLILAPPGLNSRPTIAEAGRVDTPAAARYNERSHAPSFPASRRHSSMNAIRLLVPMALLAGAPALAAETH